MEGTEGAEAAEAGEEFVGGGDVADDLEAEVVGRSKLYFFAEALPETDFDVAGNEVAGIVEEMSFDSEAGTVEGGTHADVGDAAMAGGFAFEDGAGDVNAASGKQFLVGLQIYRGEEEFAASAGAANEFPGQDERAAEKARGVSNIAFGDLFANEGAGDDLAVEGDGLMDDDLETITHAEITKEFDVAGMAMAEAEIVADNNSADLQLTHENFIHKIFGRK